MDDETFALIKLLDMYGNTDSPVSQGFYQGLCIKAKEALERQAAKLERLSPQEITTDLTLSPDQ